MSDLIPLYDPRCQLPDPPLQELHRTHWRVMQERAQDYLHAWLGVENGGGVLLFDRCTHALWAGMEWVTGLHDVVLVPPNTYRAAKDAVFLADCSVAYICDGMPDEFAAAVPTWLWGQAPPSWRPPNGAHWNIHDCAHVCYPGMFRGWKWERTMAALSFFPTKPCGAFGGGALIGDQKVLDEVALSSFPLRPDRLCKFTYPATIQSWGIMERCSQYNENYWSGVRGGYWSIHDWLVAQEFESVAPPRGTVYTPHLLPFRRTPELEQLCERAGLETGNHYPRLDTGQVENITIPFWTPEVLTRLNKALRDDGPTQRAACCPS